MDYVREGDTVVVWKLNRLGRNMLDMRMASSEIVTTTPDQVRHASPDYGQPSADNSIWLQHPAPST
jgi:DNA invertase Pin-like site-specific DNA recombinase